MLYSSVKDFYSANENAWFEIKTKRIQNLFLSMEQRIFNYCLKLHHKDAYSAINNWNFDDLDWFSYNWHDGLPRNWHDLSKHHGGGSVMVWGSYLLTFKHS